MLFVLCQDGLDHCPRYSSRAASWGHFRFIVRRLSDEDLKAVVAVIVSARESVQSFALLEVVSTAYARTIKLALIR